MGCSGSGRFSFTIRACLTLTAASCTTFSILPLLLLFSCNSISRRLTSALVCLPFSDIEASSRLKNTTLTVKTMFPVYSTEHLAVPCSNPDAPWSSFMLALANVGTNSNSPFPRAQSDVFKSFYLLRQQYNIKDSSFAPINDKDKQLILTFRRLEPANVWHFCLKNDNHLSK